ncbi:MAG: hypothetical protein LBI54_03305, partial [Lachnospiraceae bacterium]|nr:hypothetical protein [Lachnospiraceae bacterium]
IREIRLDAYAEKTLFEIFANLNNAYKNNGINASNWESVIVPLLLFQYMKISKEQFVKIIETVNELIKGNYFRHDALNRVTHFIVSQYSNNIDCVDEEILCSTIDSISSVIRNNDNMSDYDLSVIERLYKNVCFIISRKEVLLRDCTVKITIANSQYLLLAHMYRISSSLMKARIKTEIEAALINEFDIHLYCESVLCDVIAPTPDFEEILLAQLVQIIDTEAKETLRYPDPKERALLYCIDLYLNRKILNNEKFSLYFDKGNDMIKFMSKMSDFDYSKFQLDWMKRFTDSMKKRISEDHIAKTAIGEIYRTTFLYDEYDYEMMWDYVKYFSE